MTSCSTTGSNNINIANNNESNLITENNDSSNNDSENKYADTNTNRQKDNMIKSVQDFETFEFGDYYVLIKVLEGYLNKEELYYSYALLGKNIRNHDDRKILYEKLNNYYLVQSDPFSYEYDVDRISEKNMKKFIFESHIVKISEDGNKLLRQTFKKTKNYQTMYQQFSRKFEVTDNFEGFF